MDDMFRTDPSTSRVITLSSRTTTVGTNFLTISGLISLLGLAGQRLTQLVMVRHSQPAADQDAYRFYFY